MKRTSLVIVATLLVAVYPASASADTIDTTDNGTVPAVSVQESVPEQQTTQTTPGNQANTPQAPATADPSPAPANVTTNIDNATTATVTNTASSEAQSGNATVADNTTAGSATSGDATVQNTTINSLQSNSSFTGSGGVTTFSTDVDADQIGDLLLDPSLFTDLHVADTSLPGELTVNAGLNGRINNDITLSAQSGDATVSGNGSAGNATTGNASATANIVNIVNSFIGASHTFIGTINIHGNLDGDILLPGTTLAALLAPDSANDSNLHLDNDSHVNINNSVSVTAGSGEAVVTDNEQAGSPTTGQANTKVTIVNLSGQQVVGKNSLVVFVNVLGRWVGFIVDAPNGATSAALGDGITSQSSVASGGADINSKTSTEINNNVKVTANSGNATVTGNGSAGSATSGSASASANILNLTNDNLSLGGWFGILFINVFGSWHGSFGVDTAAGTLPIPPGSTSPDEPQSSTESISTESIVSAAQTGVSGEDDSIGVSSTQNDSTQHDDVLGAATTRTLPPAAHVNSSNWVMPAIGFGLAILMLVIERLLARRRHKLQALQMAAN